MRKKFNYLYFGALLILIGAINLIMFLLIEKEKLQLTEFWLAWSMFTWGNIAFDITYFVYVLVKKINIASKPSLLLSIGGINIVFLLVNLVFALSGVNTTTIIITNSILGFIAIAITAYLFINNRIIENIDEKEEKEEGESEN